MPFLQYKNGLTLNSVTVDPDQLPIFLIPGIMGNGRELYELAEALDKERGGNTPIFIYDESELADDSLLQLSLDQLADKMLDEIKDITNDSVFDIQLVGYSSGAIIGSILANKLSKNGLEPHLVAIDQPDMTNVAKYINQDSNDLMQDLINVVNVAAKLSGLKGVAFTASQVATAGNYLELDARLNSLADTLLSSQTFVSDEQRDTFADYLARAKRNLNYPDDQTLQRKISSTHLIFTKQTAIKYGADKDNWQTYTGGWDKRTDRLVIHDSNELADKGHLELVTGPCATEVAHIVSVSLRQNPQKLYEKYMSALKKSLEEQNLKWKSSKDKHRDSVSRTSGTLFTQYNNAGDSSRRNVQTSGKKYTTDNGTINTKQSTTKCTV